MSPPLVITRPLKPEDLPHVSELHARVFGPGRFARSAYRVREGTPAISNFCHGAFLGSRLIAALRLTPITIGGTPNALLLGPLVVDTEFSNQGHGRHIVEDAIGDTRESHVDLIVLVGDMPYYGRFGFQPVPLGQITLPGPVSPERILALELTAGCLSRFRGQIAAAPA
jgi:predicted N-acetyltransferase YhbS